MDHHMHHGSGSEEMMGDKMMGEAEEMDHSGMDHSGMDHSGMGHEGMDHSKMNHDMHGTGSHDSHGSGAHAGHDHHGHGNGDHMMPMFFNTMKEITFLVPGWESRDEGGYAVGWFATFFLAILVEGLLFARTYLASWLLIRSFNKVHLKVEPVVLTDAERAQTREQNQASQKVKIQLTCLNRLALSLLFSVISFLAFSLMLIVMTFEVGLLFSATIGLSVGNNLF